MLKIQKILAVILTITVLYAGMTITVNAEPIDFSIGTYLQMGKYNNEPILWRYMADDENGKLIVSDNML